MKSPCTLVLALAFLAMHLVAHEPAPVRRDPHSRATALLGGALNAYRLVKRDDGSRVQRADKARSGLAASSAVLALARPDRFAIVATARTSSQHDACALRRQPARGPPQS